MQDNKIGQYCYNEVLRKIVLSDDKSKWTPNNIRRLIIGVDGAIVQYHCLKVKNSKFAVVRFEPNKANMCFTSPDYKPIVTSLVKYICSSIEEIVFCTTPTKQGISLNNLELDLKSLVDKYKPTDSEATLRASIESRFVRLRGLLFLNMSVQDFWTNLAKKCQEDTYQLCDDTTIHGVSNKVDFKVNTWWQSTAMRPQHYILDKEEGSLCKHFAKIKEDMLTSQREEKITKAKEEYTSSEKEKLAKNENNLVKVVNSCTHMISLFQSAPSIPVLQENFGVLLKADIISNIRGFTVTDGNLLTPKVWLKIKSMGVISDNSEGMDSKQKLEFLNRDIEYLTSKYYYLLCKNFLGIIDALGREYPLMVKTRLSNINRAIYIPQLLEQNALEVQSLFGEELKGQKISDSVANICHILCLLCISNSKAPSKDLFTKEFWFNEIASMEV